MVKLKPNLERDQLALMHLQLLHYKKRCPQKEYERHRQDSAAHEANRVALTIFNELWPRLCCQ